MEITRIMSGLLKHKSGLILAGMALLYGSPSPAQDTTHVLKPFLKSHVEIQPESYRSEHADVDSLMRLGATDLVQSIGLTSPVFIRSYGIGGVSLASLRGGKPEHAKVFWNGLDLTNVGLGQTDLSLIPLSAVSDVSMNYGPGIASAASGGLGGNIELSSKSSNTNRLFVNGQLSSLHNSDVKFRFQNDGKLAVRVFGEYAYGKNRFRFLNPTLPGTPYDTLTDGLYENAAGGLDLSRQKGKHASGVSGWYRQGRRNIPRSTTALQSTGEYYNDVLYACVGSHRILFKSSALSVSSGVTGNTNEYHNPQTRFIGDNTVMSWQNQISYKRIQKVRKISLFWNVQVRYQHDAGNSLSFDGVKTQDRFAGFGSVELTGKRILILLAARSELINGYNTGFLPSVALNYTVPRIRDLDLRLAWSRNVKYPTLNQLYWVPGGNPDLKPESGQLAEAGLTKKITGKKWHVRSEVTGYYGVYDNWIAWMPGASFWSPKNVLAVKTRGLEGSLAGTYRQNEVGINGVFKLNLNRATSLETYAGSDQVGQQMIYTPQVQFLAGLGFEFRKWLVNYSQPFTGMYYLSSDNATYMPPYSYASVSVARDFVLNKSKLNVLVSVRNLSDFQYQVLPNRPMPGRYFVVNLNYTLK